MEKPHPRPFPPASSPRRNKVLLYTTVFSLALFSCFWLRNASFTTPLLPSPNSAPHTPKPGQSTLQLPPKSLLRDTCEFRYWRKQTDQLCAAATDETWIDDERIEGWEREPLKVFQVHTPPRKPHVEDEPECVVQLMRHTFAFSYGKPFVGM